MPQQTGPAGMVVAQSDPTSPIAWTHTMEGRFVDLFEVHKIVLHGDFGRPGENGLSKRAKNAAWKAVMRQLPA